MLGVQLLLKAVCFSREAGRDSRGPEASAAKPAFCGCASRRCRKQLVAALAESCGTATPRDRVSDESAKCRADTMNLPQSNVFAYNWMLRPSEFSSFAHSLPQPLSNSSSRSALVMVYADSRRLIIMTWNDCESRSRTFRAVSRNGSEIQ